MSLTRQSLLLSLGRSVASAARLLVNLGVARLFGERLGFTAEYQNVWLVFNTTYMFFILSLPSVLFYFYPREDARGQAELMAVVHQLLLVLGLAYGALMWWSAPLLAEFYHHPPLAGHLRVFAFYSGAMVAAAGMESVFNLLGRFRLLALWLTVESALFTLLALGPIAVGAQPGDYPALAALLAALWPDLPPEGAAIRAACWLLGGLAAAKGLVFQLVLLSRHPHLAWRPVAFRAARLKPLLAYALPITATSLVALLAMNMDKNIVAAWFTDKAVYARFQAGALEVPFVSVLVGSVSVVMLPHISRLQHEGRLAELTALLAEGVERVAWLVFPIFTALFVLADPLFFFFYGPAYADSSLPFRLYLLLFPLRLMFYGQVLNTLGMQRWVLGTAAADLALNITLAMLLVRLPVSWNWAGPALATVIATLAELVVFCWLLRRGLGQPVSRVFVPGRLWRIGSYALAAGAAAAAGRTLAGQAAGLEGWLLRADSPLAASGALAMIALGAGLHVLTFGALAWRAGLGRLVRQGLRRHS